MISFRKYFQLICEVTVDQVKTRFESKAWKRLMAAATENSRDSTERITLIRSYQERILELVPNDINESDKGNALNWVISAILADDDPIDLLLEMDPYFVHYTRANLELFYQIKQTKPNFLPIKAIEQIKTINQLDYVVSEAKPAYDAYLKDKAEKDTKTDINQSKVFENEEFNVYVPKTKGAAIQLGKGTDWCTAAPGLDYYEHYTKTGPLIIFVSKSEPEEWRYQFWYGDDETPGQFMDIHDQSITEGADRRKIFFYLNNIVKQLNINADVQKRAEQYKYEELENGGYMIATPDRVQYFNSNDKLDRADGPARLRYINGDTTEEYYQNGLLHREDGPATITYFEDGRVTETWYTKGRKTQDNNQPNTLTKWQDGQKTWAFYMPNNSDLHREGGPAIKKRDGTLEWRVRGMLHNPDGPAIIYPSGVKDYYLKNIPYSEEEFNNKELWKKAVYDSQFQH